MDIRLEREIEAPAADVWAVLGEGFGDVAWARGITRSTVEGSLGVGCVRTCHFPSNALSSEGQVRERLVAFDREARRMSYEITEPIGAMQHAINRWSVTPLSAGRCRVRSHATLTLRGLAVLASPLMRLMVRRMGNRFVDDLVAQVQQRASVVPAA